ncbi:MAG: zinc-binding alcohol dehydrogenase [Candidatus Rokuibacteriota bacterium]|nr:MAG: zinc-binding alcohol dehydrogenase [Candidatus Rokubacteria bacterium]
MTETGRAAVFRGPGKGFELRELPLPALEPGAILIRVSLANVCGSDLHFWRGDAPLALPPDGWIFGHEMTGRVARLGPGVETDSLGRPLAEGDRVAYCYFYPCGRCYVCLHGQRAACPNKVGRPTGPGEFPYWVGAFAEYYYLRPGGFVFRVPDGLPDGLVSPVNCALSQVIFGLAQAGFSFGQSVVIQGAGGLGLQATAVARDMGAARIVVIDQVPARLELARAFGADHTLDLTEVPDRKARVRQVRDWTDGRGADVACDLVGLPPVVPEGIEMLRYGGTYLEIGCISRGRTVELDPSSLVWGSKRIVGVVMYDPWVIPRALEFLERTRARFPFDRLVSHTFPLERIDDAFRQAEWYNRETAATRITRAALAP